MKKIKTRKGNNLKLINKKGTTYFQNLTINSILLVNNEWQLNFCFDYFIGQELRNFLITLN